MLFIALFAFLLASFPARNLELWEHLSDGRAIFAGTGLGKNWLFDLMAFLIDSICGGAVLVGVKAALVAIAAVVILRASQISREWRIPLAITTCAILATGNRLLLEPETVSILFLAILTRLMKPNAAIRNLLSWKLVIVFVLWANIDRGAVCGLAVLALSFFGRSIDTRSFREGSFLAIVVLAIVCCVSPNHYHIFQQFLNVFPITTTDESVLQSINSPFSAGYWNIFRESPAALAYYPLLVFGLISFILNRKNWRWSRFLPFLGLAVMSSLQARTIPWFAIVAGPILAWNLQEFFALRPISVTRRWSRFLVRFTSVLLPILFLISAWPGWLQLPPYEPRNWAAKPPADISKAADFLCNLHKESRTAADAKTLHFSRKSATVYTWICPEDPQGIDEETAGNLSRGVFDYGAWKNRLIAENIGRVAVNVADGEPARIMIEMLLTAKNEWQLIHVGGGQAIFSLQSDSSPTPEKQPTAIDFDQLGYYPNVADRAPLNPGERKGPNRWWEVFWKSSYPRPADRNEAKLLMLKSDTDRLLAPYRMLSAWESSQVGGLIGSLANGPTFAAYSDAALRQTLFRPAIPDQNEAQPPITRTVLSLQNSFAYAHGDTDPGILYAAVRAARRAILENPEDAQSHLFLAQTYLKLRTSTIERKWIVLFPQLGRLRDIQASTAFNKAILLNPKLIDAHYQLAALYQRLGCIDLSLDHILKARELAPKPAAPAPSTPSEQEIQVKRLQDRIARELREYEQEATRMSISERALSAVRRGLGGKARDLLLQSDVSAFGRQGTSIELDYLLRTGRPENVLDWMTPVVEGTVGAFSYRWMRTQSFAARGEYDSALDELNHLIGTDGKMPPIKTVTGGISELLGQTILDERPGITTLPQFMLLAMNRSDFQIRMLEYNQTLLARSEAKLLKGLLALELGDGEQALEHFQDSITYAQNPFGTAQLEFNGRWVAFDAISLLNTAKKSTE